MTVSRSRLIAVLLGFALFSSSVFADWEANVTASSSKGSFPTTTGKVYVRPDRVRVDSPYPMDMSFFAKSGSKQLNAAVHSFRIRLNSTLKGLTEKVPACLAKDFKACESQFKLKKVGSENCEEKTCDVFEGAPKIKGVKSVKFWHWAGEPEAILSKAIVNRTNGSTLTITFSGIEKKSRPDSFFNVPADYKDAGSLDKFLGDIRGKSDSE